VWVDLSGKELGKLGEPEQHDDPVHVSPDGNYVLASIFDSRIGTPDVWIYDARRNIKSRFTTDGAPDNNAVWSPDGRRVAFSSSRRGKVEIYVKDVEGSSPEQLLHTGGGDSFATAWSPDGRFVLAADLVAGGGWELFAIPVDGNGEPEKLIVLSTGFGASFSPSGRWFAYDSAEGGSRDVYVIAFRGSGRKWQVSTAGGFVPRWAGGHIYYFNERGVLRCPVSEQESQVVIGQEELLFPAENMVDFSVSAREDRILLLQTIDDGNSAPLSLILNWTKELPAE
jgi:dipeptidyl aminopeptidase/acylaminoacyl peptidase